MGDYLIGRQRIVDRDLNVFAYELLFRDIEGQCAAAFGPTQASNQVIVDSVLEQGLERLVGDRRAFINFTRENLLSGIAELLPKDQVVIEILESVEVDDTLVDSVRKLAAAGYTIALDDFIFDVKWLPLLELAHVVKVDVLATSVEECRQILEQASQHRRSIRLLAEKVETEDQFRQFSEMGFELFQGYFFSRPNIVRGKRVQTNHLATLRLLAKINEPTITVNELVQTIATDVGLSYRLLRYINSATFSLSRKVDSISHAVALLGLVEIRRWASLMLLASFPTQTSETVNHALVRAQMCMILARMAGCRDADQFFLVGLMSTIDQLLGCPLDEVVPGLPLSQSVKDALLRRAGDTGQALTCAIAFECWDLENGQFKGIPVAEIGRIYLEAITWAHSMTASQNAGK